MKNDSLHKNNSGIAAIEMAIILPLFLLLLVSVIQFGIYFLKDQAVAHSMATVSNALQQNVNTVKLQSIAQSSGGPLTNFTGKNNYICALSHKNNTPAVACNSNNTWTVSPPSGVGASESYMITVSSHSEFLKFSPVSDYLPPITQIRDIPINAATANNGFTQVKRLSGDNCWTKPEGVTTVKATIVGAGGGGGACYGEPDSSATGGDGGEGSVVYAYFTGLPSAATSICYRTGQGGTGGEAYYGNGKAGGFTTFNGVTAGRGDGGQHAESFSRWQSNHQVGSTARGAVGASENTASGQTPSIGTISYYSYRAGTGFNGAFGRAGNGCSGVNHGGDGGDGTIIVEY